MKNKMNKEVLITATTMAEALFKVKKELGPDAIIIDQQERFGKVFIKAASDKFISQKELPDNSLLNSKKADFSKTNIDPKIPVWARLIDTAKSKDSKKNLSSLNETTLRSEIQNFLYQDSKTIHEEDNESKIDINLKNQVEIPTRIQDIKNTDRPSHSLNFAQFSKPLSAIAALCDICNFHQFGEKLSETWLNEMNSEFIKSPIELSPALARIIPHESNWLQNLKNNQNIILVGAPGSGKTSSVAKLAAMLLSIGKNVRVVSLDMVKTEGAKQLEIYLRPLNIKLETKINPEDNTNNKITLFDTPGINIYESSDFNYLKNLQEKTKSELTVMLPCDLNPEEAEEISKKFISVGAKNLIATRTDLSRRHGSYLRSAYQGLKLVMLSKSPKLDDGLEEIKIDSLFNYIFKICG